jgi:hypothetical protein
MLISTLTNAITALVRLSSLSMSGLLIPSSLISALDNLVKEEFANWRDVWFDWLLTATALVLVGLALEGPELYHEIRHLWLDRRDEKQHFVLTDHKIRPRWKLLSFIGWILIVVGVAGEGFFETMVSLADGKIQTFNNIILDSTIREAGDAAASAKIAHDEAGAVTGIADEARADAKDALAKARAAQGSLADAENDAAKAQEVSSSALSKATEAESHLKDALKEAALAQDEINRLKAPRSLTAIANLVSTLTPFKDTEFGFIGVYGDQESIDLAGQISAALQLAGWKPAGSPNTGRRGLQAFWLKGFSGGAVSESIRTGVHIEVTSEETPEALNAAPAARPKYIKAAFALKDALARSISPKQDGLAESDVGVQKFNKFTVVLIDVGNKPMTSAKTDKH